MCVGMSVQADNQHRSVGCSLCSRWQHDTHRIRRGQTTAGAGSQCQRQYVCQLCIITVIIIACQYVEKTLQGLIVVVLVSIYYVVDVLAFVGTISDEECNKMGERVREFCIPFNKLQLTPGNYLHWYRQQISTAYDMIR